MEGSKQLNNCIFCGTTVLKNSIEHIVPESLGNKSYVLSNGFICGTCNNNFSKFEDKALTKTFLAFERTRLGIATKKGNAATAKSGNIIWKGSRNFKKDIITMYGLTEDMIEDFNPKDGSFKVKIPDFDKSEMATSKLLLKIGFEALFVSKNKMFKSYDFTALKEYLTNKDNKDWPFISTNNFKLSSFESIPAYATKYELSKIRCKLNISEVDASHLIFDFNYSKASYMINLLNRDFLWAKDYLDRDILVNLYPEYLKAKIKTSVTTNTPPVV
jgi:hypothetical protein